MQSGRGLTVHQLADAATEKTHITRVGSGGLLMMGWPHETLLPLRRKQRRLPIPARSTLLAPMVYQM